MSSAERDHTPAEPSEPPGASAGVAPDVEREPTSEEATREHIGINARYAGCTAVGLVREHNEDNFLVSDLTARQAGPHNETRHQEIASQGMIFAVCDGMGGAAAGEVASQSAVDTLFDVMTEADTPSDRDAFARRLVQAVQKAGRDIFDTAQADRTRRGMGTTATVAGLIDSVLFVAQVGDSRAYLLRNGELELITKDQSLVNQLIEAGHLTEEEAESFEHSNIILQALGTSESVQVDLTFVELRKGDRLLLCSDGLSGMVHGETIRETLLEVNEPAECCTKLIELANAGGGHDNITVIVSDFDGEALQEPKTEEHIGYMQYPLPEAAEEGVLDASAPTKAEKRARKAPPSDDKPRRRNAQLVAMAAAVLVVALAVAVSMSTTQEQATPVTDEPEELAQPAAGEPETTAHGNEPAQDEPPAATDLVQVQIRTDVEDAELLVNGEPRGPLNAEEDRSLELPPGAYRFEARSDGSIAASSVITLRPDEPREIELRLPSGSTSVGGDRKTAQRRAEAPREKREAAREKPTRAQTRTSDEAKSSRPETSGSEGAQKSPDTKQTKQPAGDTQPSKKTGPAEDEPPAEDSPATKGSDEQEPTETKPETEPQPPSDDAIPDNPF